jgi:hypothetical protein
MLLSLLDSMRSDPNPLPNRNGLDPHRCEDYGLCPHFSGWVLLALGAAPP